MWIKRLQREIIMHAQTQRPVILLTGIRQVGKSSLLKRLYPKANYISLDHVNIADEAETNPSYFLSKLEGQVIIDEVQYAPSLFRYLKIEVDNHREIRGRWILTGSQRFSLIKGINESLAGRCAILQLHSLSAAELNLAGLLKDKRDLLWKGGFPEIWAENLDAPMFYADYIQTYLERDLREVLDVTNLRDFRRFMSLLAVHTGQLLNLSSVAKDISVSVNTVKSWVNALEVSGLIYLLPPYYANLGKRLIKAPKVFFCDNGLLSALLHVDSEEMYNKSLYRGALWENFTFTELIKAGHIPGRNLFYYRDQNGVEVDFIIEHKGEVLLVEAKESENPNAHKLNFSKVAPLFKETTRCFVYCTMPEQGILKIKDYFAYNPLHNEKEDLYPN
jgi:predicted AAA+ superfamily ATPase